MCLKTYCSALSLMPQMYAAPLNPFCRSIFHHFWNEKKGVMLPPRDIKEKLGQACYGFEKLNDGSAELLLPCPWMDFCCCQCGGLNMFIPVITWWLWGWLNGHLIRTVSARRLCFLSCMKLTLAELNYLLSTNKIQFQKEPIWSEI